MSDFDDRPFVAGSVYGLRSFGVDKLGRLTGVSHKKVWTPGENVAQCASQGGCSSPSTYGYGRTMQQLLTGFYSVNIPAATTPDRLTEITAKALGVEQVIGRVEVPEHRPGGLGNACGYWAFFDGTNDYHDSETVAAIVEGYGTVTIGTRGFRAQKAKIAALILPASETPKGRIYNGWRKFARWADRFAALAIVLSITGIVASLVGTIAAAEFHPWLMLLTLPVLLVAAALGPASFKGIDYRHEDKRSARQSIDFDRIRQNYADVPVFSTVKAALKAFPVAHPEPPSALTPETCDDFWTRSAS